jgi:hypothetical protein
MTGTPDFGYHVIKHFLTRYHKNEPTKPNSTRLSFIDKLGGLKLMINEYDGVSELIYS